MNRYVTFIGAVALMGIAATAFRIMFGVIQAGEADKQSAVIAFAVILLIMLPTICHEARNTLFLWKNISLVVLGITSLWLMQRTRRSTGYGGK